jgi:hypothetical protein
MKGAGLTLDQINYQLHNGLLSKEDGEEIVKWWNENRVTTAHLDLHEINGILIPHITIEG